MVLSSAVVWIMQTVHLYTPPSCPGRFRPLSRRCLALTRFELFGGPVLLLLRSFLELGRHVYILLFGVRPDLWDCAGSSDIFG